MGLSHPKATVPSRFDILIWSYYCQAPHYTVYTDQYILYTPNDCTKTTPISCLIQQYNIYVRIWVVKSVRKYLSR